MGEDFIRKTNKAYRRLLQDSGGRLEPSPLYLGPEEATTVYPCQLMAPDLSVAVGARLTLLRRAALARVAILDGNRIIGSVAGDAAKDLGKLIDKRRQRLPVVLGVKVESVMTGTVHFEVSVVARKRGMKKGAKG